MSVLLASSSLAPRQLLLRGRVSEAITGRGLAPSEIRVEAEQGAVRAALPVTITHKPGGWYGAHLVPRGVWPVFAPAPDVTLWVTFTLPGRAPSLLSQTVSASALDLTSVALSLAGQPVHADRISGAPFDFSLSLDPLPVALAGTVIRDHDPSDPIAGVTLTAAPAAPVLSDAQGQFFIPALPVLEQVQIGLSTGGPVTNVTLTPDYARRVNMATLSLSGA